MAKSKPVNFYFRLEAAAWYGFAGGLRLLGVENAAKLGAAVVPVLGSFTSAHKTSLRNIRMCFPNENEKWHRDLRAAAWREVGRMSGEFPNMDAFLRKYQNGEVEFKGSGGQGAAVQLFGSVRRQILSDDGQSECGQYLAHRRQRSRDQGHVQAQRQCVGSIHRHGRGRRQAFDASAQDVADQGGSDRRAGIRSLGPN